MSLQEHRSNLVIKNVCKEFGTFKAVNDLSLDVQAGEFVTLLGPSGSGKTTLLMMIAGFVQPDRGGIELGSRQIGHLPPEKRDFGMVFQGYALFPHLTVAENVAFPLKVRKRPKAEIEAKVREALELVHLTVQMDRLPRQLSGGQQQRVALARAMVFTPHLLLLDEPLSALDKKLRAEMQEELKRLHQKIGLTFIYVTHDQDEALSMSDRVAVMRDGQLVQYGSPEDLYERPQTAFVADFLGRSSVLRGVVEASADDCFTFAAGGERFLQTTRGAPPAVGSRVAVALRPEKLAVIAGDARVNNTVSGTVSGWNYYGSEFRCVIATPQFGEVSVSVPAWKAGPAPKIGQPLTLGWEAGAGMQVAED